MGVLSEKSFSLSSYSFNPIELPKASGVKNGPALALLRKVKRTIEVKMIWRVNHRIRIWPKKREKE